MSASCLFVKHEPVVTRRTEGGMDEEALNKFEKEG